MIFFCSAPLIRYRDLYSLLYTDYNILRFDVNFNIVIVHFFDLLRCVLVVSN